MGRRNQKGRNQKRVDRIEGENPGTHSSRSLMDFTSAIGGYSRAKAKGSMTVAERLERIERIQDLSRRAMGREITAEQIEQMAAARGSNQT